MYPALQLSLKYLRYYLSASNGKGHGIHSPFIFDLVTRVIMDRKQYPEYERVEALRSALKKDSSLLQVEDMGAGSARMKSSARSIRSIVKNSAKPKKYGQLLFRMARFYKPESVLELGTSLGITTSYFALANPGNAVITLEGAKAVADVAARNFQRLSIDNVVITRGNFDDTLPQTLAHLHTIDMVFIDGNHRKEPTLHYFDLLVAEHNNDTILVFDDIHWSREMEVAWKEIQEHPSVRCTVDLFFIGIVLFRREFFEKQHFTIRF